MAEFFQFGIKVTDGRRSGVWRLASSESGAVLLYAKSPTDALTVTLEPDGTCRLSTSPQAVDGPDTANEMCWSGITRSSPGALLLYRLVFPVAELRRIGDDKSSTEVAWVQPCGTGNAIEVLFYVAEADPVRFPGMAVLLVQDMTATHKLYVICCNITLSQEKLSAVANFKRHIVKMLGEVDRPGIRALMILSDSNGSRSAVEVAGDLLERGEYTPETQSTAGTADVAPESQGSDDKEEKVRANDELSIEGIGIHLTDEVGATDDLIYFARIIPDGRDGRIVYARTLHHGEPDPGLKVTVRPQTGEILEFREGSLCFSTKDVDDLLIKTTPTSQITNTLWTWFRVSGRATSEQYNYILAAGRRLDGAKILHSRTLQLLDEINQQGVGALRRRHVVYDAIATAEIFVIGFSRALQMIIALQEEFDVTAKPPADITTAAKEIREIRNAYEHIDDRAFGKVKNKPTPEALSVFDYTQFITSGVISYAGYQIDVRTQTDTIFAAAREYLLTATGELCGTMQINNKAGVFFRVPKELQNRD